ncbi:MAG: PKD domain-containing protein [Myxococcales bacterium]|nr:PKD domain-containing protein [Myxococcales bacterium]
MWTDDDGDGYGDPASPVLACGPGDGVADNALDCNDADASHSPDTIEVVGNDVDEDCDGYVDEYAVGPKPNPFQTFEDALRTVPTGVPVVIQFDAGTYFANIDLTTKAAEGKQLTLAGEGCDRTQLFGQSPDSVVRLADGAIERITLSGGSGTLLGEVRVGGGVLVEGAVTMREVCVDGNSAANSGGGIAVNSGGSLTLEDSRVTRNASGALGAGIYVREGGSVELARVQILDNESAGGRGGGMAFENGSGTVRNTVIAGNSCATQQGCGVAALEFPAGTAQASDVTFEHVTWHDNRLLGSSLFGGARGSALWARNSIVTVRASLVTGHADPVRTIAFDLDTDVCPAQTCTLAVAETGFRGNAGPDWIGNDYLITRIAGDPAYVASDASDAPLDWDLRLLSTSDFLDASTTGDLGAFGGLPDDTTTFADTPFAHWAHGQTRDSDADGLTDGFEDHYGTNRFVDDAGDDPDADGRTSLQEADDGTDPLVDDTDIDGVSDGDEATAGTDPGDPRTNRPIADAGKDRVAWVGDPVEISGSASFDPNGDPLTYSWDLLSVPGVSTATLSGATTATASLTPDEPGTYELQLTASDGAATHTDLVQVRAFEGVIVPDDFTDLQAAVVAAGGDAVGVRAGEWLGPIVGNGDDIVLVGLDDADSVVIQGDSQTSVITSTLGERVTLANLTLTGGHSQHGGGVWMDRGAGLELFGVHVTGNSADLDGGGVRLVRTPAIVHDTTFSNNVAGRDGGGLSMDGSVDDQLLQLERTVFARNEAATNGGGMHLDGGNLNGTTNFWLSSFVCQENTALRGACWRHSGSGNDNVFASNGAVVGHRSAPNLVWSNSGSNVMQSLVFAGNDAGSDATATYTLMGTGSTSSHQPFDGLVFDNVGRDIWPDDAGEVSTLSLLRDADPQLLLYTDDGDPSDDVLVASPRGPAFDAGFIEHVDPDGSRSDIGLCGGALAATACSRFAVDLDADGMSDGWELAVGLDPSVADDTLDPDGDGLDNAAELAAGTHPFAADSDDDGVSDDVELGVQDPTVAWDNRPVARVTYTADPLTGLITLDGTGSMDPNGDALTYDWSIIALPAGSAITDADLVDAETPTPWLLADVRGTYRIQLVVNDGTVDSLPARPAILRAAARRVPEDYPTIEEALAEALPGDAIQIGPGTYEAHIDPGDTPISVVGAGRDVTILRPAVDARPMVDVVTNGVVQIRDLTMTGGWSQVGGAVSCERGDVSLTRVTIERSAANQGGALGAVSCTSTLIDVDLHANTAAVAGGALHIDEGTLSMVRGTISENTLDGTGGGGGANVRHAAATFRNVLFLRNWSDSNAGSCLRGEGNRGSVVLDHVTFAGNLGTQCVNRASTFSPIAMTMTNSLLVSSNSIGLFETGSDDNLDFRYNGFFDNPIQSSPVIHSSGPTDLRADPLFVDWDGQGLGAFDLRLLEGSPMVDSGDGLDRDGTTADRGAFGGPDAPDDWDLFLRDTDGDGMPDGWELRFGLDPALFADGAGDVDGDGLDNLAEYQQGTDPTASDSDGDGVDDATEVADGTDPTSPLDYVPVASVDVGFVELVAGVDGTAVDVEGSGTDPNAVALTPTWTLVAAPGRSVLTDADLASSRVGNDFTATFTPDTPGVFALQLTVNNGSQTSAPAVTEVRVAGEIEVPADYGTMAEALDSLAPGSTLRVAAGTWPMVVDRGRLDTTIIGAGRGLTILDGEGQGTVFSAAGVSGNRVVVHLEDLTITGGLGGLGGGVFQEQTNTTLINVELTDNVAGEGGGIYCHVCSLDADRVTVTDNGAGYAAGGIRVGGNAASLTLTRALVAGNLAPNNWGGGLLVEGGGGGTVRNVVFADNEALVGGGIAMNSATAGLTVDHVTATHNTGINSGDFAQVNATNTGFSLTNSIVVGHDTSEAVFVASAANYDQDFSLFSDNAVDFVLVSSTAVVPTDGVDGNQINSGVPDFTALSDDDDWTNEDWTLGATSDAVDAGDPAAPADLDDSTADLGAFGGMTGDWTP